MVRNKTVAKTCSKTRTCNSPLVKRVTLKDKHEKFYPIKFYCYNGIINELERILQFKDIPEQCESWRTTFNEADDTLADVHSGRIWKEFQTYKGKDFLKSQRSLGLMMNFDFFQPIKHRKDYSVGVLYLAIINLPRSIRFKWENIVVVGIIPTMNGEPKNLNEFLKPAVHELHCLWKGLHLKSALSIIPLMFRAALLCIAGFVVLKRTVLIVDVLNVSRHSLTHSVKRMITLVLIGIHGQNAPTKNTEELRKKLKIAKLQQKGKPCARSME